MISSDYLFGGSCFRVESDEPIEESGFYPLFRSECTGEPDFRIRVLRAQLPSYQDHSSGTDHHFRIKRDGAELTYTCFSDNLHKERTPYACEVRRGSDITLFVDYDQPLWDTMIFDALSFPDMMLERSVAIIHSSFIGAGPEGILFAGSKGQGKSTQAELWRRYKNALIINGDRALVRSDENGFSVFGIPFCGSSKECLNENRKLKAVVFPEKGTENRMERLGEFESFKKIIGCISYTKTDPDAQEKAVAAAERIALGAPCFRLICTPDERAVGIAAGCLGI